MIPFAILLAFLAAPPANKLTPVDETVYPQLIAAQKGNVVLVNFWATWCEPCRAEIPALISLEKKLHADGFKLVLISADEIDSEIDARRFLEGQKASMPSYQKVVKNDDKFIDWLEPKWSGALPALFLYDRAGKKVKSFIGETEMPVLEAEIRKQLSAGKQKSLLPQSPKPPH